MVFFFIFILNFFHSSAKNFISIQNTHSDILVENINIIDNVIGKHFFDIFNAQNLTLIRINCSISNTTIENRDLFYSSIGGCIRTKNIFHRKIENLRIINSFSDMTSFGIKIIDEIEFFSNISKNIEPTVIFFFIINYLQFLHKKL